MKLEQYCLKIEKFIADYLSTNHGKGYVLGISGGIDSALVAAMSIKAVGKDKLKCLILPIESQTQDILDAILVCEKLDLEYRLINLTKAYKKLIKLYSKNGIELDISTKANLKARLRMATLYSVAQKYNSFVLGTDNMDERYTGYFTKYGDGGVDLLPIAYLLKNEVREAAKAYNVPQYIIEKAPSADLFEGQTDEKEMGVSYKDLDNFLLGKKVNKEVENRILHLHKISEHKRIPIPTPEEFKR